MKVIKYLAPLLCALQLAGCGDDDLAESSYTPPTDYTFDSRTNDVISSSVSNEIAVTQEILIQELITLIRSNELQAVPFASGSDSKFQSLYSGGTLESINGNLSSIDIYSSSSNTPTGISIANEFLLPALQVNYSELQTGVNLEAGMAPSDRKLRYNTFLEAQFVGEFIGWELIDEITDGNEMPQKLIDAWFTQLGVFAADGDSNTRYIDANGLHVDRIIGQLLRGRIHYSKLTQYNLISNKGLLSQNVEAVNASVVAEQEQEVNLAVSRVEQMSNLVDTETRTLSSLLSAWQALDPSADISKTVDDYENYEGGYPFLTAAEKYFSSVDTLNNYNIRKTGYEKALEDRKSEVDELSSYTLLAKNWDEAFGYFGAARNYGERPDSEIIANPEFDIDGDGTIDLYSEVNFGFAMDAAMRDETAALANMDFSGEIWNAFIIGRHIIQQNYGKQAKEYSGYHNDLKIQADTILENIEMLAAANIIHTMNKIISDIELANDLDSDASNDADNNPLDLENVSHTYYENWSTLKGMLLSLQFNDNPRIEQVDLVELHTLIGEGPIPDNNNFLRVKADLEAARSIIEDTYSFDHANVVAW